MPSEPIGQGLESQDAATEALSNEVLKLKIDDLFQELENLKRRVERLERQSGGTAGTEPKAVSQEPGIVSDPDRA
jgi:hypothetical protein